MWRERQTLRPSVLKQGKGADWVGGMNPNHRDPHLGARWDQGTVLETPPSGHRGRADPGCGDEEPPTAWWTVGQACELQPSRDQEAGHPRGRSWKEGVPSRGSQLASLPSTGTPKSDPAHPRPPCLPAPAIPRGSIPNPLHPRVIGKWIEFLCPVLLDRL